MGQYSVGSNSIKLIIVILVVLWLLGLVSSYTMGGFLHILLVIAVILLILRLVAETSLGRIILPTEADHQAGRARPADEVAGRRATHSDG